MGCETSFEEKVFSRKTFLKMVIVQRDLSLNRENQTTKSPRHEHVKRAILIFFVVHSLSLAFNAYNRAISDLIEFHPGKFNRSEFVAVHSARVDADLAGRDKGGLERGMAEDDSLGPVECGINEFLSDPE